MRYFCLLLLSLLPLLAGAVDFDEHTRSLPLGQEMAVFEDVRGAVSIADASSAALAEGFHQHSKPVLNAGYSRSAFWLRLDLNYRPQARSGQQPWLLEIAYPPLDQIELYLADGQGGFQLAQRTGDSLPFASRQMAQNNYVFKLNLQPNELQRLYLRVQSQGAVIVPLTLWSPTAYLEELPGRIYVLGIIYGVLLVMLLYNLFIFISVRDSSYFYYIVYIAAFGLYQVSVNGVGIQYFWPNNPWWANAATPFLIGLAAIAGCQFARSFLHTRKHSPWIDRLLMLLMASGLLTMLLALFASYAIALRLATALALLFTVIILLAGILAWRRGLRVARYFVFAWSAFLLGGMVNTLMVLGLLPNTFWTMYASQIGSALEVGLLSLALADRINVMKEERAGLLQQNALELEALNRELANSNRLKDEFLATVTHELRTPMNGVIGSLELMQTLSLDIEVAQYQKTAAASARDMMRMVNDILALTELQAGKLHAQNSMFSLRAWLDSVRVRYAPQAAEKGLKLRLELDQKLPDTLQGDGAKLSQCVGYLLDNAIKFTAAGSVTLRIKRQPAAHGLLGLLIEVQDSGVGFDPAKAAPLYQRFQQLDGSLTREYGGLGVGLAICQQLIELLGGTLRHQSQPGQGSCFTLTIELDLLAQTLASFAAVQRPQGPQVRTPAQCRVLIVEDNGINQLVLRGMLLKLGYQVRCADNGAAALDLLRYESVDALLLDCQMPGMDGFATCRALRLLPGCSELPVLAVTAHSHSGDRERCLAAGMSDYLTKPLKFDTLQVALHDWLLCTAPL
jgi:signal transduction histidine kinase/CheY-like chemotaxis protein